MDIVLWFQSNHYWNHNYELSRLQDCNIKPHTTWHHYDIWGPIYNVFFFYIFLWKWTDFYESSRALTNNLPCINKLQLSAKKLTIKFTSSFLKTPFVMLTICIAARHNKCLQDKTWHELNHHVIVNSWATSKITRGRC